nr:MAG TPA: hypothetical protein [Caudoviricetes sp.]
MVCHHLLLLVHHFCNLYTKSVGQNAKKCAICILKV